MRQSFFCSTLESKEKDLVIILGPTAVGKSSAAVVLARKFGGEIVNCDSRQVYRGFDIGTDKPPAEMRQEIPHHLLDIVDASVQFTAADFAKEALAAIDDILERGRLPFLVGGTGLYLKALFDGLFPGPGRDARLREEMEKESREIGLESLWKKLQEADPEYARKITSRDRIRIIRALEVYLLTGKPISEHFRDTRSFVEGFNLVKIGLELERQVLYRKIEERIDRMFEKGIIAETEAALAGGVEENAPPFKALGYKHVLRFLKSEVSLEEAVSETKKDTRRYAKRQMTWFRKMPGIAWFSAEDLSSMQAFIEARLS